MQAGQERCLGNEQVIGSGDQPFRSQVGRVPLLNMEFEAVKGRHSP